MDYNIRYDADVTPVSYKGILNKKIGEVVSKLAVDVKDVEWVIYEAEKSEKILHSSITYSVSRYGHNYGFYPLGTKEIWISTKAIIQTPSPLLLIPSSLALNILGVKKDILVDVIMDEIAHIKTNKNHGEKEYDDLLSHYHRVYYNRLWQ